MDAGVNIETLIFGQKMPKMAIVLLLTTSIVCTSKQIALGVIHKLRLQQGGVGGFTKCQLY